MIDARLTIALSGDALALPDDGRIVAFEPPRGSDLPGLDRDRLLVVQDSKLDFDDFSARGFDCATQAEGSFATAVVCLPRARREAQALLARAFELTDGPVIVDGQKTDGIDAMLRQVRRRARVEGPISKAHGKLFWLPSGTGDRFADWAAGPELSSGGFWTAPGVFSADGIDPASAMLADALPEKLGPEVADLGAGWGFLSAHVLTRDSVRRVHLVEAGHMALQCAQHNLTDPRAVFHWADATRWQAPERIDTVVMNPPFHTDRAADPRLGQAFVAAAARILAPQGQLWMVANRHLPYESTLKDHFAMVAEAGGDSRFKLLQAARPVRRRG
ncbi:class I SAM-dependent methyltransferase [Sulfitobacter sp. D35]|uniref:class I SAM-dependent methyltransferase n=1 Tax=Sulfitobacter sp. D35 TaxID=3083252 RepID=UPI002970083F|nr:class I SAM-dependent methyltransferase [Sulfitobacter sp. D35]MDW4497264.1 class I SAM-dependent methyltransferase [Sulfitobacter sp. D35]